VSANRFNQFLSGRNVGKTMYSAVSIAFMSALFATAAATFSVSELPNLGGGSNSTASGINDKGDVIGSSYNTAYALRSTTWPAGGAPVELPILSNATTSEGMAVSSTGIIVGKSQLIDYSEHAMLWSSATSMPIDLGTLGGFNSVAYGVNSAGDAVGNALVLDNSTMHAVLWPASNHVTIDLGTLPGGTYSEAKGINAAGVIVGNSDDATGMGQATLWSGPAHTPVLLQTLGGKMAVAFGINDNGDVVGYSLTASNTVFRPTLWAAPGHLPVDIGTLAGGSYGGANSINNVGDIVGYSATSGDIAKHAAVWSSGSAPTPVSTCKMSLGLRAQSNTPSDRSERSERSDRRRTVSSAPVRSASLSLAPVSSSTAARVLSDLGTLPGGSWSEAKSINTLGQVVGLGEAATLESRAMFWKPTSVTPPPTGTPPGGHDGDHQNQGDEDGDC
jgi:probable HAF family extracellular repeat protein